MNMTRSEKPSKPDKPTSSPDKLTKSSKKGKIELTEGELDKVSGGPITADKRGYIAG